MSSTKELRATRRAIAKKLGARNWPSVELDALEAYVPQSDSERAVISRRMLNMQQKSRCVVSTWLQHDVPSEPCEAFVGCTDGCSYDRHRCYLCGERICFEHGCDCEVSHVPETNATVIQ